MATYPSEVNSNPIIRIHSVSIGSIANEFYVTETVNNAALEFVSNVKANGKVSVIVSREHITNPSTWSLGSGDDLACQASSGNWGQLINSQGVQNFLIEDKIKLPSTSISSFDGAHYDLVIYSLPTSLPLNNALSSDRLMCYQDSVVSNSFSTHDVAGILYDTQTGLAATNGRDNSFENRIQHAIGHNLGVSHITCSTPTCLMSSDISKGVSLTNHKIAFDTATLNKFFDGSNIHGFQQTEYHTSHLLEASISPAPWLNSPNPSGVFLIHRNPNKAYTNCHSFFFATFSVKYSTANPSSNIILEFYVTDNSGSSVSWFSPISYQTTVYNNKTYYNGYHELSTPPIHGPLIQASISQSNQFNERDCGGDPDAYYPVTSANGVTYYYEFIANATLSSNGVITTDTSAALSIPYN